MHLSFPSLRFWIPILIGGLIISTSCEEAPRTNVLGSETSPYLLQHAGNPVHWQPWSDAIWDMARKEDKLVLISIGYASCHWCHVMEEETFENDSVAHFMNERFINVKVDREERPDVDQIYMTAVQLMTGKGGWPLNVLVLPNGKPLYGGTYHTREQWLEVLARIDGMYRENPARAREYADKVAQGISETNRIGPATDARPVETSELSSAVNRWKSQWDTQWGGTSGQQKFMMPVQLEFLMDHAFLSQDTAVDVHLKRTLNRMALGGVYDQLGGGFYRYSTDAQWRIPHFEKMLYDNAQLLGLYARAYSRFGDPLYRQTAQGIFNFLQREMKDPKGGYFAAMDADSEGEEGAYYLWKASELEQLLGPDFSDFATYYDIAPETAWEGHHVLFRPASDSAFAAQKGWELSQLADKRESWHLRLMQVRTAREAPGIDRKVLTSWNALLVSGLAEAFVAFGEKAYLEEARGLMEALLLRQYEGGQLRHSSIGGVPGAPGFLEDYAFLGEAAFKLYEVSGDPAYLKQAETLLEEARDRFEDSDADLFRFTEEDELIAVVYKSDDGVYPSPNTAMAGLLLKLGHFHLDEALLARSRTMVLALRERFGQAPANYSGWGRLMLAYAYPYFEVATVGPDAEALHTAFGQTFMPNTMRVFSNSPSSLPLFANRYEQDASFIYVCRDHSCRLPVPTAWEALEQVREDLNLTPLP